MIPEEPLVTIRDLARVLNCSGRQAYRVATRVPKYRVGRMLRFRVTEVLQALKEEAEKR